MAIENLTPELDPDISKEGVGVPQAGGGGLTKSGGGGLANGIGSKLSKKMNASSAASDVAKDKIKEEAIKKGAEVGAKVLGTAIGGPVGTAIGYVAGKLIAKFGPQLPKIIFFTLLGIATLIALITMLIFSIGGDGRYFGSRPQVPPEQSNMEKVMAYAGDASSVRKLLVDKGDELIADLKALKTVSENSKLTAKQKKDVATKVDAAIVAVDEARDLLGGEGTNISTTAQESIQKVVKLIGEVQKITGLLAVYGNFYLPMGMLTCHVNYNKTPHPIAAGGGHDDFIVQDPDGVDGKNYGRDGGALDYIDPKGRLKDYDSPTRKDGAPLPVYAIVDSYVYKEAYHKGKQNYIKYLNSEDGNYQMAYAHITNEAKVGKHFSKGDVIGYLLKGNMGTAHLHFEFWLKKPGVGGKIFLLPTKEREQLKYFCGGVK